MQLIEWRKLFGLQCVCVSPTQFTKLVVHPVEVKVELHSFDVGIRHVQYLTPSRFVDKKLKPTIVCCYLPI
jgi:hypothetical protein